MDPFQIHGTPRPDILGRYTKDGPEYWTQTGFH